MPISVGVSKQLGFKKETTWGTLAGASGGQLLRRVSSNLSLKKDTYQSNEIRPDLQIYDYRHGARRVEGTISGELSPGTYSLFHAAMCRRDFVAVAPMTAMSITIAAGSIVNGVQQYTVTRSAGDFIAGGLKIGMVFRLSVGTFNAANLLKNMLVVNLTTTVATVIPLNGVAMFAEGPITSSTLTVIGKTTYQPQSAHTNDSFTIEHWFSDISISHQYAGCRLNTASFNLPATGITTVDWNFLGKDRTRGVAQYFTTPTAATTVGVFAAVNGVLTVGGSPVAVVTGLQFDADLNRSAGQVVGANTTPDIFGGSLVYKGQFSAYFQDDTYQAYLDNETEFGLTVVLTVDNTGVSEFISYSFPRCKVGSADVNDGQIGLVQQLNFMALLNGAGGAAVNTEKTTLQIQDSLA